MKSTVQKYLAIQVSTIIETHDFQKAGYQNLLDLVRKCPARYALKQNEIKNDPKISVSLDGILFCG
jgi:hypothetical protein